MANTNFYLIRHGEVDNPSATVYGRKFDVPLNGKGKLQTTELTRKLQAEGITPDIIYSSPLKRTRETAEIIQSVYGDPMLRIKFDDGLLEIDAPILVGKLTSAVRALGDYYAFYKNSGQLEQPEDIAERVIESMRSAQREYNGKNIFIVSHGDPMAFAITKLRYPDRPLPSIAKIDKDHYPMKGEACRLIIDESGKATQISYINTPLITR